MSILFSLQYTSFPPLNKSSVVRYMVLTDQYQLVNEINYDSPCQDINAHLHKVPEAQTIRLLISFGDIAITDGGPGERSILSKSSYFEH